MLSLGSTTLFGLFVGCETPEITVIPAIAEAVGLSPALPDMGDVTDMCCFPGASGQQMAGQCEDDLVYENVCARVPACCDTSWYPQCASAYATYASGCATLPEAGAGSSNSSGGGGSYSPTEAVQKAHPSIRVQLLVDLADPTESDVGGNLFLAGFAEVEEHTARPGRGVRPDHYTQLATFLQDWPYQESLMVFSGLHYWAMIGSGEHPGPGDRMSDLTEARADLEGQEFRLIIGSEQIPAGGGGEPPAGTKGN